MRKPHGSPDDNASRLRVAAVLEQNHDAQKDLNAQEVLVARDQIRNHRLSVLEVQVRPVEAIRPATVLQGLGRGRPQAEAQDHLDGSPSGLGARLALVKVAEDLHERPLLEEGYNEVEDGKVVVHKGNGLLQRREWELVVRTVALHGAGRVGCNGPVVGAVRAFRACVACGVALIIIGV